MSCVLLDSDRWWAAKHLTHVEMNEGHESVRSVA